MEEGVESKTATEKVPEKADKPPGEKKNGDAKKGAVKETKEQSTVPATTSVEARAEGKTVSQEIKNEPVETLKIEHDASGSWVEFHIEMTLNLGNMEFGKIHIGRRAPHKATEADADAAIKVIKGWARREFRDEVNAVREKVRAAAEKRKSGKGGGNGKK